MEMSLPTDSEEPLRSTTLVFSVPVLSPTVTTIWSPAARIAPHAEFFVSHISFQFITSPSAFSNRVRISPVVSSETEDASLNSATRALSSVTVNEYSASVETWVPPTVHSLKVLEPIGVAVTVNVEPESYLL